MASTLLQGLGCPKNLRSARTSLLGQGHPRPQPRPDPAHDAGAVAHAPRWERSSPCLPGRPCCALKSQRPISSRFRSGPAGTGGAAITRISQHAAEAHAPSRTRSISLTAISSLVRAVRRSSGTPAPVIWSGSPVQVSGRNSARPTATETSPRASVSDTSVWQLAVLPSVVAYAARPQPSGCPSSARRFRRQRGSHPDRRPGDRPRREAPAAAAPHPRSRPR